MSGTKKLYEVNRIVKARRRQCECCNKCLHEYLVNWVGYASDQNTWEPYWTFEKPAGKQTLLDFERRVRRGQPFMSPGMTLDAIPDLIEPTCDDDAPLRFISLSPSLSRSLVTGWTYLSLSRSLSSPAGFISLSLALSHHRLDLSLSLSLITGWIYLSRSVPSHTLDLSLTLSFTISRRRKAYKMWSMVKQPNCTFSFSLYSHPSIRVCDVCVQPSLFYLGTISLIPSPRQHRSVKNPLFPAGDSEDSEDSE